MRRTVQQRREDHRDAAWWREQAYRYEQDQQKRRDGISSARIGLCDVVTYRDAWELSVCRQLGIYDRLADPAQLGGYWWEPDDPSGIAFNEPRALACAWLATIVEDGSWRAMV